MSAHKTTSSYMLLFFCVSFGALLPCCGRVPDLKIQVARIPDAATYLWALVWRGQEHIVPEEQLLFETGHVPSGIATDPNDPMAAEMNAYGYSFGLNLPETDSLYVVTIGGFSQSSSGFCLRRAGSGVQPAGFRVLTNMAVILDEAPIPDNLPGGCYTQLDGQQRPIVTSLSAQIDRSGPNSPPSGTLIIHGWNFSPRASVDLVATINDQPENLTPTQPMQTEIILPTEIRVHLNQEQVGKLQDTSFMVVTVTNPGTMPLRFGTKLFE